MKLQVELTLSPDPPGGPDVVLLKMMKFKLRPKQGEYVRYGEPIYCDAAIQRIEYRDTGCVVVCYVDLCDDNPSRYVDEAKKNGWEIVAQ